jgi:hypothetical protein
LNPFEILFGILRESYNLFSSLAPYLLLGFFAAGILYAFIPPEAILRHLSGIGLKPVLKASIFGVPLPLCSCGVIPVAASLRKQGASKASTLSFFVSTPTTGVDSILATYSLMGLLYAVFRPVVALFSGVILGLLSSLVVREEDSGHKIASHPHPHFSIRKRIKTALSYGFFELVKDIYKWILIGVFIGGIIGYAVPTDFIERYLGNPLLSFTAMLIIGIPMYVCATGSIPIVASLLMKGMNPGAAMVFLIAGPATNTVTITVIAKMLGKRILILYLSGIMILSILFGGLFNLIFNLLGSPQNLITGGGRALPSIIVILSSIALALLIVKAFFEEKFKKVEKAEGGTVISVPDISCDHCKMRIESSLKEVRGIKNVYVDVDGKRVILEGDFEMEEVIRTIENAGYTPEV